MAGQKKEIRPGVWKLRVSAGKDLATGKYIYIAKTVHGGPRLADQELARLVAKVKTERASSSITVSRLLDEWFASPATRNLAPSTIQGYTNLTNKYIRPALGSIKVEDLTARHLDALYDKMLTSGLSTSRIRHCHAIIRRALGQAAKWDWLSRNVATQASPPPVRKAEMHSPSPEELNDILRAAAEINPQLAAVFELCVLTGARRGEVLALRWSDCDLVGHVLWIRRAVSYTPMHGTVIKDTKNHQLRKVAVGSIAEAVIRSQISLLQSMSSKGFNLVPDPYIFFALPDGSQMLHPDTPSKVFRKVCDSLGLPYHLHQLRHFAGTELVGAGHDPRTVAGRLGHDVKVLLGTYSHALEAQDRAAAEYLERLIELPTTLRLVDSEESNEL